MRSSNPAYPQVGKGEKRKRPDPARRPSLRTAFARLLAARGPLVALGAGLALSLASALSCALALGPAAGLGEGGSLLLAACVAAAFLLAFALAALIARVRQRRIARLVDELDVALSAGRRISFASMEEGELALLSNRIGKAIDRLAIANEGLQAERGALARSLADVSHQIRTPLTALGLELELLRAEEDPDRRRRRLAEASLRIDHIQWLVSALLTLSRSDAGALTFARVPVDAEQAARAAFEPLAVAFELKGVAFRADIREGAGFSGDREWTREALSNVLKNCLEHAPAGGTVSLSATEDTLACRFRIEDDGPGIADEDLPHVFERFYRGRTARPGAGREGAQSPLGANAGIGLALARALVNSQGGTITASNRLDAEGGVAGARFDLVFFKAVV